MIETCVFEKLIHAAIVARGRQNETQSGRDAMELRPVVALVLGRSGT